MAAAHSEIARVLDGARRRQRWVVLGTAFGFGASGLLLCGLLGAALLGFGVGSPRSVRLGILGLAGIVGVVALTWAAAALLRRASTAFAVATAIGRAAPELRGDLVSSVELTGDGAELAASGAYSRELVDAHVARTGERVRGLDLTKVVPAAPARRAIALLAAALLANLAFAGLAPKLGLGWKRLLGAGASEPVRRAEPITGDVELTYVYPAYMNRPSKTLSGTGGEVSAPKGTEVSLRTLADRPVETAELELEAGAAVVAAPKTGEAPAPAPATSRRVALEVKNGRELAGRFTVGEPGAYRFRFTKGKKSLAEGPAIPISVEADAFPEVRITAPAQEVEVDARARIRVEWSASDDVGLSQLALVVKPPAGEERRTELRAFSGTATRRDAGSHELELAPFRLGEGERLLYWVEARDNDAISGPKRAASTTHTVKIFSEAEHHRAALARATGLWEELVKLLGDRLELVTGAGAPRWTAERLARASALDARTRGLHESLRAASRELRKDRSAPKELAATLGNVAAGIRPLEEALSALRPRLGLAVRFGATAGDAPLAVRVAELDGQLDRELEKDALYLESLFDKQRADDLVRVARDLSARRRELAELLEKYRQTPSEEGKKELLAEVARMKARMADMMRRMGELAKGIEDEHMNKEALAELSKSQDALGGLDRVEKLLAQGDVEGAMKELDRLGNTMQQTLAALERTAGTPSRGNAELMRELQAFKKSVEEVKGEQERVARETEKVKDAYRKAIADSLASLEPAAKELERLAGEARSEVGKSEKGVTPRSEDDFSQARERLSDLERALQARDLDAALETARRALPPMQRLALGLSDDAAIAERYRGMATKDPRTLREAQRHAGAALDPARKVKDALERMFPDPRSALGEGQQKRLEELAQEQGALERKAGDLKSQLSELAQKAPVFPPGSSEMLGGSQGHMRRAQGELAQKNPQRGHGEQRQALDELARLERGLDEMGKRSGQRGGGASGGGFPFPMGEEPGGREGDGADPSQEKVEIPGAEAYRVPDDFRKDLLDTMKQGAPEAYKGEVERYYEELVK